MIEAGTNLDAMDEDGDTALAVASGDGNIGMVKLLHEAKADLNVRGWLGTALHGAVAKGHTQMLKVTVNEYVLNVLSFRADLVG